MKRMDVMVVQVLLFVLLVHHGTPYDDGWAVRYPPPMCVVEGSTVSFPCTYEYPLHLHQKVKVIKEFWCKTNTSYCDQPPYVYNSTNRSPKGESHSHSDFKGNCTLQIRNMNKTHSGEYRFRFETDSEGQKWTEYPGMSIEVTTLKLSVMGRNVTGSIKEGDPVNLTCSANCTAFNSSEISWFKDRKELPETGPELILTATSVNSGNYTCGWRNGGLRSNAFKMDVEYKSNSSLVTGVVCFAVFVATGAVVVIVIKRRRKAAVVLDHVSARSSKAGDPHASDYQNWRVDEDDVDLEYDGDLEDDGDLEYASVSLQPKAAHNRCRGGQQQKDDGSVIYSTVAC